MEGTWDTAVSTAEILGWLNQSIEGAPENALAAAFIWGILSILLSPCHLASIPLIIGFLSQAEVKSTRRAAFISTLFALGIMGSIALIGLATSAAGRMLGDLGPWANYLVAGIFFLMGLVLLEVVPLGWSMPSGFGTTKRGAIAAMSVGLLFGIALGPCTFAFMAPVLGVSLKLAGTSVLLAVLLILSYGIGHCAVIVLAGTFSEKVQLYLNWSQNSGGKILAVKRICGILVILGGFYLIFTAW